MSDLVWIRSTVESGTDLDEDYIAMPRAEWDAMSGKEQDNYLTETAVDHQNNVAPCGASVVDESEVPAEYRGGGS